MNQKKKIFNLRLYLQSLKQLKIIGIMSTLFLVAITIMIPVNSVMSLKRDIALGYSNTTRYVVDVVGQNSFLIMTFVLITPLLTLVVWNFMTKRNASDFYHSLPYTRLCTYLSNIAAVISWQFIMLFLCGISSSIIYLIYQTYLVVDFGMVLHTYVMFFVCNLLCTGAISIACMLTGTLFSNICVSGLVIFFPRFLMVICENILTSAIPFAVSGHTVPLLGQNSNIVTGVVYSFFRGVDPTEIMLSNSACVYTGILGVIYLVLAGLLFIRRKSEAAGRSAISGKLQFTIRVIIGLTVGIVGAMAILDILRETDPSAWRIVSSALITMLIIAFIIIVYECINAKSIRGIVKSIPSILIAYVFTFLFILLMNLWTNGILNYRPDVSDIKSVSFSDAQSRYWNQLDYFQTCSSTVVINETHIKQILCEALNDNLEAYDQDSFYDVIYSSEMTELQVKFNQSGIPVYRNVYLTKKQMQELGNYLNEIKEYKEAYLDLPTADEASIYWGFSGYCDLTKEDQERLYNMLVTEAKQISFDDWYSNVTTGSGDLTVNCNFIRDGHNYTCAIPVTDVLPQTKSEFYKILNQQNQDSDLKTEIVETIKAYAEGERINNYQRLTMEFADPVSHTTNELTFSEFISSATGDASNTLNAIADALDNIKTAEQIDMTRPYIIISYYADSIEKDSSQYNSYEHEFVSYVVQLDGYDKITDYYPVGSETTN